MPNYRIILSGVQSGRSLDAVVRSLSQMSRKPPTVLRQLLDGRQVVVKRTFEVQKAVKYRRALEKIGCVCTMEADMEPAETSDAALTVNFTTTVDAHDNQKAPPHAPESKPRRATKTGFLGAKEGVLVAALLLVFYLGYKILLGSH